MAPSANASGSQPSAAPTDNECALCYEDFCKDRPPVPLDNCRHVFCQECLDKWVASNNDQRNNCPTCRTPLFNKPNQHLQAQNPRPGPTPILHVPNNHPGAAEAAFFTANELLEINETTHNLWSRFKHSLAKPSSFYRRLNRHVRRTLLPLYMQSNELLTPALDIAARTMLIELLPQLPHYDEEVAIYRWHLQQSLQGHTVGARAAAYHRLVTRRLVQFAGVMVMLGAIGRINEIVAKKCFKILGSDLNGTLNFVDVNAAAYRPDMRNAPLLAVFTSLLANNSVAVVRNGMGAQWYIGGAQPSNIFAEQARKVKEDLADMSHEDREAYANTKVRDEEVLELWDDAEEDVGRQDPRVEGRGLFGGLLKGISRGRGAVSISYDSSRGLEVA